MEEKFKQQSRIMTGESKARNYLNGQNFFSDIYLNTFYKILQSYNKTGRYLEIGAGPGYQTARVMNKFKPESITIVEPSLDMLSVARDYLAQSGFAKKTDLHSGFVEDEQLLASLGKFDLIYSTLSLHHWGDPVQAFRNLVKALKPDGVIVIQDFRRINLPFIFSTHSDSHRVFSTKDIEEFMSKAGIEQYELTTGFLFQILTTKSNTSQAVLSNQLSLRTLDTIDPDREAAVVSVNTDNDCSLELRQTGIVPTARVKILDQSPLHTICKVDQRTIVVDHQTASEITMHVL